MTPDVGYFAALEVLAAAERDATRYPDAEHLRRVVAARAAATAEFERLSAEARARRPVPIGQMHVTAFYRRPGGPQGPRVVRTERRGTYKVLTDGPFGRS
jgi:hypothetical protein